MKLPNEAFVSKDPIRFDDLCPKYRVEAVIKADFTGIYLDAEQYRLMERGPDWKLQRLFPNFLASGQIRDNFAQRIAPPQIKQSQSTSGEIKEVPFAVFRLAGSWPAGLTRCDEPEG